MRNTRSLGALFGILALIPLAPARAVDATEPFVYEADRFADIQVLRYQVPGFEELSLKQKKLAYYLTQAGLAGRDIFFDQKYRHNLVIRKTLEAILNSYQGERAGKDWEAFVTYAKQVFFANGIHHHYASVKMLPAFPQAYLSTLLTRANARLLPLEGKSVAEFTGWLTPILFDPSVDAKTVNLDAGVDHVVASANNFYRDVTAAE
ncbi:MAG TPA: dihydrofolate reductase, partial [Opitutaceae bacterium]